MASIKDPLIFGEQDDETSTSVVASHTLERRRFALWMQFAGVASYFACDIILRFLYQTVLKGKDLDSGLYGNDDEAPEEVTPTGFDKPAFLTLCCYMSFVLWGPLLVFPYITYKRGMSIRTYYTTEWCGALGFSMGFRYAFCMATVLFFGNLFYIIGLEYVSVALSTAVGQGEAPFTVGLSVLLLGRVFGKSETRGIVLCFTGIALIAIPPVLRAQVISGDDGDNVGLGKAAKAILIGVLSTALGAFGFGSYQVFWPLFDERRFPPDAKASILPPTKPEDIIVDTFATIFIMGVNCILFGWIFILFLHYVGWETFELPTREMVGPLALASLMAALVDALNAVACVVATAVVVALAYPLTIPMSVVLDYFINGIPIGSWGLWGWIGTIVVVAGVFSLESPGGEDGSPQDDVNATNMADYGTSGRNDNGAGVSVVNLELNAIPKPGGLFA
jgi:drug/metabolite transporter (DMT)-like permease